MKWGLGVLAAVAVAYGVACGGGGANTAPSAPKSAAAGDGGSETFGEVNPADVAELNGGAKDAGAAGAGAAAAAGGAGGVGAAGGAGGAGAAAAEPADECAPVGVDFEKRARPKIKECYREAKKKEPDLKGSIRITLEIDYQGKTKGPKIVESTLPKAVSKCMLDAVKATPMPEAAKCPNKTVTIPVTFPTPP